MDINTDTIIIFFLGLLVILYVYNDFLKPYIKGFSNDTSNVSVLESFTSKNDISKTAIFDTNWYLRDSNQPVILNNKIGLPVITYGYYENGSYEDMIGHYFRKHIYPIDIQQLNTNLDTIYKFINGDMDIAFISEELFVRYIKQDCKYLTRYIIDKLGIENYDLSDQENIARLYPPINFSAIGIGYHQDFYLLVNNYSNILEFLDIKNKSIGVLEDSYYYFMKICSAYDIDITAKNNPYFKLDVQLHLEDLISNFKMNKYDAMFVVLHPKNKQLLKLSLDMKLRYIHLQKRVGLDARNNLDSLFVDQQGTNNKAPPPPPDINRQAIYSKTLMDDLQTENIKESFNKIIKKYFQYIMPRSVDLNKFHKSGNRYTYLETFSTRMILVIRNDIPEDRVKYITRNYVDSLNKIRDSIDREQFTIDFSQGQQKYVKNQNQIRNIVSQGQYTPQINNFSSEEFNYEELISFDSKIPLAAGAREVYKEEGLIYYVEDSRCNF